MTLTACGGGIGSSAAESLVDELADLPTVDVHADDFRELPTAEALLDSSDVVVAGVVSDVAQGSFDEAPELEDFGGSYTLAITLEVESVIAGTALRSGQSVTIESSGYEVDENEMPSKVYIANGIPIAEIGSKQVWFLRDGGEHGWVVADGDDARFALTGDTLRALADTAGPAAKQIEQLGVAGLRDLSSDS